jgi:ATP-dependent RNA helicase DOB1
MQREEEAEDGEGPGVAGPSGRGLDAYLELRRRQRDAERRLAGEVVRPGRVLPFLKPGRLVRVQEPGCDWGWGIVVSVLRQRGASSISTGTAAEYTVDTLLHCAGEEAGRGKRPVPPGPGDAGAMHVVPVNLTLVRAVSTLRVTVPPDLRPPEARQTLLETLLKAVARLGGVDRVPQLDPVADMNIDDPAVAALAAETAKLQKELEAHPAHAAAKDGRLQAQLER